MNPNTNDHTAAKVAAIAARRAARPAWRNAHFDRQARECEARTTAKEYGRAQREAARSEGTKHCSGCDRTLPVGDFSRHKRWGLQHRCKPCMAEAARASYHRRLGQSGTGVPRGSISPDGQRKAAERIAHLTALLHGTAKGERISSQDGWEATMAELHTLWSQSGDKECVSCKAMVPPSAMLPPGPANFYPGHCRSCARIVSEGSHRAAYGPPIGPLQGPPKLLLRDNSRVTIAELARRCREREQFRWLK